MSINLARGHRVHLVLTAAAAIGLGSTMTFAQATASAPAVAKGEQASGLPEAKQILKDSVKAMGGKKAIDKIETLHVTSEMSAAGMAMTTESWWSKAGAYLVNRTMPMGEMSMGYDGTIGWMSNPMGGYAMLTPDQIEDLKDQASMHMKMLRLDKTSKNEFASLQTVDKTTFKERECYKLHFVEKGESPAEGYIFFDVKTMLPFGWMASDPAQGVEVTMELTDWKEVEGVKFFGKMSAVAAQGESMVMTVTEIGVNDVEASAFEAPAEVKEQASAAKSKPAGSKSLEDFTAEEQQEIKQMLDGFMSIEDPAQLEQAKASIMQGMGFMPPEKKDMMQYVVEQVDKRIAQLRGG